MKTSDLGDMVDGAKLQGLVPYLAADVEKIRKRIEREVFKAIDAGTLSGDMAIAKWQELRAYERILGRLDKRVKIGVSAGERLTEDLTIDGAAPISGPNRGV